MFKEVNEQYYINFVQYNVHIVYKRMRNIHYRYDPSTNTFNISAPILTSKKKIYKHLEEFAPGLIKRTEEKKKPILDSQLYFFGRLINYELSNKNIMLEDRLLIKAKEDINKVLKKELLKYLSVQVPHYETLMNAKKHKISVRNAKTRFGSNSPSSNRLCFSLSLVHYSKHLIDSVIMHELSHDKHFDHSQRFYDYLKTFSPDYKICKNKLDNTDYSYGIDIIS